MDRFYFNHHQTIMINLNEWPEKAEEHKDWYKPSVNYSGVVPLSEEQYELAAKAVRLMAQMEEKTKPDCKGNWLRWSPIRERWESEWIEKTHIMDSGRWIKIPTPEGKP